MSDYLLEPGAILPPLLEQQISPPYRIVARHLDYLQKWREYLLWVWAGDLDKEADKKNAQRSVDECIHTIMLIGFVKQLDYMAIPTLEEILKITNKPTAFNLCEAVYNSVSCKLLKAVFNPEHLRNSGVAPQKNVDLSSLAKISETAKVIYRCRMPVTIMGDFYQLCLSNPIADKKIHKKHSDRHTRGVYYTPAPLVDYLVFRTFEKLFRKLALEQVEHLRILDPSCGCGAFLIATLRFLLKWLKSNYNDNKRPQRLSPQKTLDLLESMIYGTDIDEWAIQQTRRLLLLTIWDFYISNGVSKDDIQNMRIPTLEENITCEDFLEGQSLKNEAFQVIIGGPPFVRVQELYKSDREKVESYKRSFRVAKTGQFDLYMLFIEKSIEQLANHGYLSMSVSNTFLRSESGRALRQLIAEKCTVGEIIEFEDSRLYQNATVQIAVIMLQKTAEKNTTKHVFIKAKGSLRRKLSRIDKLGDDTSLQIRNLPVTACASGNWVLDSESEVELLYKIESTGSPLGKLPVRICFGTATEADNVFLLKNAECLNSKTVLAESRFLGDGFVFEYSILRPILRGRHIKEYTLPEPETLCIFPYDETGKLYTEDMLRTKFPLTYKYLKRCEPYLVYRKQKRIQPWYAFRSEDVSGIIQSPKIVGSVVNSGGGFAMDRCQQLFCNNSVILICPDEKVLNVYFLLAILNSKVFRMWAQRRMPTLGSGWYCYRVGILRGFPMPVPQNEQDKRLFDEVVNLTVMLLNESPRGADRANTISLIDNKICKLYGVSQGDLL
ncbi:MAG: N-6 DNA methylase [Sedimentisphaerales bacterium]